MLLQLNSNGDDINWCSRSVFTVSHHRGHHCRDLVTKIQRDQILELHDIEVKGDTWKGSLT